MHLRASASWVMLMCYVSAVASQDDYSVTPEMIGSVSSIESEGNVVDDVLPSSIESSPTSTDDIYHIVPQV